MAPLLAVVIRYPTVLPSEPPAGDRHASPTIGRMPIRVRRPRHLPAELVAVHGAFERCAEHVDLAQRAMLRCVPSSARSMALPLDVGAQTVRIALDDARALLPSWRHEALEPWWLACGAGIEETLAGLDGAVATAQATVELEVALTAVQDLLDPLHAFIDAAERFKALRVRA